MKQLAATCCFAVVAAGQAEAGDTGFKILKPLRNALMDEVIQNARDLGDRHCELEMLEAGNRNELRILEGGEVRLVLPIRSDLFLRDIVTHGSKVWLLFAKHKVRSASPYVLLVIEPEENSEKWQISAAWNTVIENLGAIKNLVEVDNSNLVAWIQLSAMNTEANTWFVSASIDIDLLQTVKPEFWKPDAVTRELTPTQPMHVEAPDSSR